MSQEVEKTAQYQAEEHALISEVEKTKQHQAFDKHLKKVNKIFIEYDNMGLELEKEEKKLYELWLEVVATEQWQKYKNHLSPAAKESFKQWEGRLKDTTYRRIKDAFELTKEFRDLKILAEGLPNKDKKEEQ